MRLILLSLFALTISHTAHAFCGIYVARADGELFNTASKVVYVRDGTQSVITMASDYRGPAQDFAMIVPAPTVMDRDQIRTVTSETITHLDAYSAPRLVEYFDDDPCAPPTLELRSLQLDGLAVVTETAPDYEKALGVTIEAEYAVGIYDIVILSAEQSDGLTTYLQQEGYKTPDAAAPVLADYIAGGMKFFVARVNLDRHDAAKTQELPPLQLRFDSKDFMLPLQLGKVNADGEQSVLLYAMTRQGRVAAANYPNIKIPTAVGVPGFVEDQFGDFYTRLFNKTALRNTVVTEYAWDMAWCDPCAADPLSPAQLQELGVTWAVVDEDAAQDVFITRMHFRYGPDEFTKDLQLLVTQDRENYQGRYIITHPFDGPMQCEQAADYIAQTKNRLRSEALNLGAITDWPQSEIDARLQQSIPAAYRD